MKRFLVIALLLGRAFVFAEDPVNPAASGNPRSHPRFHHAPHAWLGLEISRPDESITVHLPELPPGIGFMIRSITVGGPAEAAGLKEFDVIWKMGDQMLVNEGQLAALLRLSKPGDEVMLAGFRAGKPLEVKLKLGEAPKTVRPFPDDLVESAILPGECRGTRIFNIADKIASFSTEEGKVEVWREGEVYKVKITSPKDEPIYAGDLPKDGGLETIPENWKRRVYALRRGLDHALESGMAQTRQPRPRVVPPPAQKP